MGYTVYSRGSVYTLIDGQSVSLSLNSSLSPTTVGPEKPHTYNNPEWEAATREKLLKYKANPIEGISSRLNS